MQRQCNKRVLGDVHSTGLKRHIIARKTAFWARCKLGNLQNKNKKIPKTLLKSIQFLIVQAIMRIPKRDGWEAHSLQHKSPTDVQTELPRPLL